MSSMNSSAASGGNRYCPLYEYVYCKCGVKALLKIVDTDRPSRGRLYFTCAYKVPGMSQGMRCDFFKWCHPINGPNGELFPTNVLVATEVEGVNREGDGLVLNAVRGRGRAFDEANMLEAAFGRMVYLMVGSVVISAMGFVIAVFK